jgi:hypothetical protein
MQLETWMFDLVLLGVAAEFALLAMLLRRTGHGRWISPVFWFLVSGGLLMMSVRLGISGGGHVLIGGVLFASLLTHLACLWSAWRLVRT